MTETKQITIESTRDRHGHGRACLLRWGAREWYATVADVRATAMDLFTCAAYADMIGVLLQAASPPALVLKLSQAMLAGRRPRYFGTPRTLYLLPAGSSARGEGCVLLSQHNRFGQGKADAFLGPDEARIMGRAWLETAEASESDTLFSSVLERAGWLSPEDLDALFGLLAEMRAE